jgi:hypothetical protein
MRKSMKDYKNLIIVSLAGLALVFYRISQNERFKRFEQRSEVYTLKQENNALKADRLLLIHIISHHFYYEI